MKSLFVRILVWFWLTMTLVGVMVITITVLSGTGLVFFLWSREAGNMLALCGEEAIALFDRDGAPALNNYLHRLQSMYNIRLYMFNEFNEEMAGQDVPDGVKESAVKAALSDKMNFALSYAQPIIARPLTTNSGTRYVVARRYPRNLINILYEESRSMAPQLVVAFLLVGVFCYWLARYLTAPIVELRAAARRLAEGDLTVRAGRHVEERKDEIADLAHDFNFMAERIETLMSNERLLLRDISHELRSPLARLNVALELARQCASSALGQALDRIGLEADRLNDLIGQLLTLARLEGGFDGIDEEIFDLTEMVQETVMDADFEATRRKCSVRMLEAQTIIVKGNRKLLRSAVENVVRNAVRYTNEGTEVEIVVGERREDEGCFAVVSIRDHGSGVPEEALDDLVRPFYRVADARERKSGGSGIGLAITERSIRLHGGSVMLANSPSGGLMVEIRLPVGLA